MFCFLICEQLKREMAVLEDASTDTARLVPLSGEPPTQNPLVRNEPPVEVIVGWFVCLFVSFLASALNC